MKKWNLYIALLIQFFLLTIFFYIDAINIIEPIWKKVLNFGLNPLVLLFYALAPIALWWTHRTIYQFTKNDFWYAGIIHTLLAQIAYLGASYIVTQQPLSSRNWLSILLGIVGIAISA